MTDPNIPAPATKKTSPWLFVGLGCGGLILLILIAVAVLGWMGKKYVEENVLDGKSFSEFAADMEANPEFTAVETMIRLNPEIELVSSDKEAGTVTLRQKSDGTETTISVADFQEGKLTFEQDGQVTQMDASSGQLSVVQTNADGEAQTVTFGAGEIENHAEYARAFIIPAATDIQSAMLMDSGAGKTGTFFYLTAMPVRDAAAAIEELGTAQGITFERNLMETGESVFVTLSRSGDGAGALNVVVSSEAAGSKVTVTYQEATE